MTKTPIFELRNLSVVEVVVGILLMFKRMMLIIIICSSPSTFKYSALKSEKGEIYLPKINISFEILGNSGGKGSRKPIFGYLESAERWVEQGFFSFFAKFDDFSKFRSTTFGMHYFEKSFNKAKKKKEKPCSTCLQTIFWLLPGTRKLDLF